MASLLEIRKKMQAVDNSRKITKAMQLVASSKMRVFQRKALNSRYYALELLRILEENSGTVFHGKYSERRTKGVILFVLYTSDKGLCGPLNTQLMKKLFQSEKWLNTPADKRLLITIGRKAHDFTRAHKIPVEKHFKGIPEQLTIHKALPIIDAILDYWHKNIAKEIHFVVSHYKNTFTTYPILKTFLPFSREMVHSHRIETGMTKATAPSYKFYEPSKPRVFEALTMQIIQTIFFQSFFELKASEYSSRMIAMQNSTESARKIVNTLKLDYNKLRQQMITQELAELVGGFEEES